MSFEASKVVLAVIFLIVTINYFAHGGYFHDESKVTYSVADAWCKSMEASVPEFKNLDGFLELAYKNRFSKAFYAIGPKYNHKAGIGDNNNNNCGPVSAKEVYQNKPKFPKVKCIYIIYPAPSTKQIGISTWSARSSNEYSVVCKSDL